MPTFIESIEAVGNTWVDILNGLGAFHEKSVATGELLAQRMVDTRNEIQSGLRPLGDSVDSVGTVAIETNEIVESIRTQDRESKEGVRDPIRVLQSRFRRVVPLTQHPTARHQLPAVPPATVEVAVPNPRNTDYSRSACPCQYLCTWPLF